MSGRIRYSVECKIDALAQALLHGCLVKEVVERLGVGRSA